MAETLSVTIISPHSASLSLCHAKVSFTKVWACNASGQLNSFNPLHTVHFLAFCVRQTFFFFPKEKHLHVAGQFWTGGACTAPEPDASCWPRWLRSAARFVWITISSPPSGLPSPSPPFFPLCEFGSLPVNELASDTYLPTLILDVTHPCHFPAVCPKRLSSGHKGRGSKVRWPLTECTIIRTKRDTSSCRNPTGTAKCFQKSAYE